ncbi:MAG: TlpA family protein disulfide reductase [Kouleothrix sp.]|nr:TlpA family protein disulfide reductase [Kouleothrix sp.]
MMRHMFTLALAALALAACGGSAATTPPQPLVAGQAVVASESKLLDAGGQSGIPEVGQAAPDFQYTMPDGTTHRLSDLRGKKVLLNFWATWCGPCRSEMPDIQKAIDENGGAVVVLGVNKAEQPELIAPFADELKVGFLLIANPDDDIPSRYAAINLPTSYFINTDGTIGLRKTGLMSYSFIKAHLDQLK